MSWIADIAKPLDSRRGPAASMEFRRIQALPRRVWDAADDLEELRVGLTEMLKRPEGTMALRPLQAAALRECHDLRGMFGPICVGAGKTLITLLAPVVCEAERPVLLVPAALRDQTLRKMIPEMREHWQLHPNLQVIGYSEISLEKNADLLFQIRPDMIIADESHALKNRKSGRTRRVLRYMAEYPMTTFIAVSGTVANFSVLDYWHTIQWALKPDNSPVPKTFYDAKDWSLALDERVHPKDRMGPGVLPKLVDGELDARQAYRIRLVETPGVIATGEDRLGTSLYITERKATLPLDVRQAVTELIEEWETPNGDLITEAVDLWRHVRTMLCGFYYQWNPNPPEAWLEARREWKKYVRHVLRHGRKALDTELQVFNHCKREQVPPAEFLLWRDLKDTFKLRTEPVWFNNFLLEDATAWLNEGPGICWVEHIAFGQALSGTSGKRYFGAGDSSILDAGGAIIASIAAHGTGKNLQKWNRNLVVTPPTGGKTWEQLLGRTHRFGQEADEVTFEVYQYHQALKDAMEQAVADATFLQDSLGNEQRLLYCDRSVP